MCLILVKPEKAEIPEGLLRTAYNRNQDGWGIMRATTKGKPFIKKGLGGRHGFDDFLANYQHFKNYACAIHFRASSEGRVDLENTHPFRVSPDLFMMHNGHFSNVTITEKGRSDTWHFAKALAKHRSVFFTKKFIKNLEKATENQRLVFFNPERGFIVLNKHYWFEDPDNGVLYSNLYSFDPTRELLVHNFGEDNVRLMEEREKAKKDHAPGNLGAAGDILFQNHQEYIELWHDLLEEQMQDSAALAQDLKSAEKFYDRETEALSQDEPSVEEYAAGIEIENIGRDELRQLCQAEPDVLSRVIYRTLQKL